MNAQSSFGSAYQGHVTFTSTNTGVVKSTDFAFNAATNELDLTPTGAGSTTVYVYVDGVLQNSIPLTVSAAATPAKIVGLTNVPSEFENGATFNVNYTILSVVDQYNRPFTLSNQEIDVTPSAATSVTVADTAAEASAPYKLTIGTDNVTLTGTSTVGTETLTFAIKGVSGSSFTYTVGAVANSSVTAYTLRSCTDSNRQRCTGQHSSTDF